MEWLTDKYLSDDKMVCPTMFSIRGAVGGSTAASMLALQMAQHTFEAAVVIGRV